MVVRCLMYIQNVIELNILQKYFVNRKSIKVNTIVYIGRTIPYIAYIAYIKPTLINSKFS